MILSGDEIQKELGKSIIITPFNEKQLNPNSYNLRIDDEIWYFDQAVLDMKKELRPKKEIIPEDGYLLVPGRLYLGKTMEYTESHKYLPCIEGRSSIGRLGINVHITAGFGDVGFCGCWTLELSVIHPVVIYPHIEICQIYYQEVKGDVTPYDGKYNNSTSVVGSRMYKELVQG